METQVVLLTTFILVKDKIICAYMKRNSYFTDHITGWLGTKGDVVESAAISKT